MTRPEIVAYSKGHGMILEVFYPRLIDDLSLNVFGAWAPLVRGYRFDHPALISLAKKYGKYAPKILLRYSLQRVK
jgi:diketogulonate reductase-like aldo/keto reductase